MKDMDFDEDGQVDIYELEGHMAKANNVIEWLTNVAQSQQQQQQQSSTSSSSNSSSPSLQGRAMPITPPIQRLQQPSSSSSSNQSRTIPTMPPRTQLSSSNPSSSLRQIAASELSFEFDQKTDIGDGNFVFSLFNSQIII